MTGVSNTPKRVLTAYTILLYVFLYVPVIVLVLFSFNSAAQQATFTGFSTEWYAKAWDDRSAWDAARMSLKLSVATVITSVSLGTAAAIGLRYTGPRLQRAIWPLLLLPMVLPEIAMAVAFLRLFGAFDLERGFATVWLSHVAFSVSYVIVVVNARLAGMDQALEEAAADLGARPLAGFFYVTLPQLWPAIASAAMLVFALSIDDYVITSFVAGVGNTTVPVYVYGLFKKKITPEIHAISTLLLSVTTPLIAASWWLDRRQGKPEET